MEREQQLLQQRGMHRQPAAGTAAPPGRRAGCCWLGCGPMSTLRCASWRAAWQGRRTRGCWTPRPAWRWSGGRAHALWHAAYVMNAACDLPGGGPAGVHARHCHCLQKMPAACHGLPRLPAPACGQQQHRSGARTGARHAPHALPAGWQTCWTRPPCWQSAWRCWSASRPGPSSLRRCWRWQRRGSTTPGCSASRRACLLPSASRCWRLPLVFECCIAVWAQGAGLCRQLGSPCAVVWRLVSASCVAVLCRAPHCHVQAGHSAGYLAAGLQRHLPAPPQPLTCTPRLHPPAGALPPCSGRQHAAGLGAAAALGPARAAGPGGCHSRGESGAACLGGRGLCCLGAGSCGVRQR